MESKHPYRTPAVVLSQDEEEPSSLIDLAGDLAFLVIALLFLALGIACAPVAVTPAHPLPPVPYQQKGLAPEPEILHAGACVDADGVFYDKEKAKQLTGRMLYAEDARQLAYELGREEVEASLALANKRLARWSRYTPLGIAAGVVVGVVGGVLLVGALDGAEVAP